jgi:hypothetical protein
LKPFEKKQLINAVQTKKSPHPKSWWGVLFILILYESASK